MVEFTFNESPHKFTDPIRFFKANDPYYYEVDNIPLKQIHENTLWLKDQVSATPVLSKVQREDLDELRPWVDNSNNLVTVNTGRFMGRVNDAYELEAIQHLVQVAGLNVGEMDEWEGYAWNSGALNSAVSKFFAYQAANVLNLNGLAETVFSHPILNPDSSIFYGRGTVYAKEGRIAGNFPGVDQVGWVKRLTGATNFTVNGYDDINHFTWLATLNTYFVKKWRGVIRTAVCDVSEQLTIEVPPFDPDDFFSWEDVNGVPTKVRINGPTQRIDLLFIYTKPIDTASSTVAKFVNPGINATPTTIFRPELGLVHGAGIGVTNLDSPNFEYFGREEGTKADGTRKMMANPSDELSTTNGFLGLNIHGSFPSPDDLMNLTPSIAEDLGRNSFQLVGQSILPIAYIVVKQNAALNSFGKPIITSDDIIDIRPFFRTAELAYNERAGIAAAYPALSLANPAVGKFQLDKEIRDLKAALEQNLNGQISSQSNGENILQPKIVGAGYVLGGGYFGVESVFMNHYKTAVFQGNSTWEEIRAYTRNKLGFSDQVLIPDFPDWDVASWAYTNGNLPNVGLYPNDYIEVFYADGEALEKGCFADVVSNPLSDSRITSFGTDNVNRKTNIVSMLYCKKEFNVIRPEWMRDYHVEASFLNCVPLTCRAFGENSQGMAAPAGIWVTKANNKFTIHCAWVANDLNPISNIESKKLLMAGGQPYGANPLNNRSGPWFAGIVAMSPELGITSTARYLKGMSFGGAAIYPSIQFKITGYPVWSGWSPNNNNKSPTIKLT